MYETILLIEDNKDVRENTAEILELAKYKVLTSSNGKEGVQQAKTHLPDLIISDIMMPELDGYGVLHMLSKDAATAGIPFIFLTAKSEKSDLRKGMSMGADDYLVKPFDSTELMHVVDTRIRKSKLLKTGYAKTAEGLNEFINAAKGIDELNKLSAAGASRLFAKKSTVYSEGGYPKGIYFLNKGKIKTFKSNPDGKEYITELHSAGAFIGYTALLEGVDYTESAEALEDSEVVMIPREDFFSLLYSNRDVAHKFIKLLSNNLVEKEERLLKLAYDSVRKRVAEALVIIHERYSTKDKKDFSMEISREDIANMVGTATETVVRTLSDFKEDKRIDMKGSRISILDLDKLKLMSK